MLRTLRTLISAVLAVQLLVCPTLSFAQGEQHVPSATPAPSAGPVPATQPTQPVSSPAAAPEAAAPHAGADKITAIKVSGNRRIETAVIMPALRVKAGEALDPEKVDADLKTIYQLGYFKDVKAQTEPADGGVILEYVVQEKPIVREVKVEGAKELAPEKVRDAVEIKPNAIFSQKDLQKSIKKVKKLYADEGYYLAEVTGDISMRSETELNVIFRVKEGDKVLIKSIRFEGNHAFKAKKLKKAMETSEKWMFSWLTGAGTYKEETLKNDMALLTELYMNDGYINVKIGEPKVELTPDRKALMVTIGITEGEQYRIGKLDFKGDLLEHRDVLFGKLKEKSGEIFSRSNLRADIFTLTDFYADKGYAFANVAPITNLNREQRIIDISFDLEKGEKVNIDRINISGNTKTRDKVVRRELRLAEGELYSSTALKRSKQNLMNTGFFEEANLVTAKGSASNKLDLNVDVKEKPTGTFSIGAGYSSLDGIIGQGSVQQANFLGLGLKMTAAASFGSKSQTYNLGLTDPYFNDTKWTLGGDLYRNERQYLDYTRRATGGDIKAGYPFSDTLSTFWLYKYEQKEIFDESPELLNNIANGAIVAPEKTSTTSAIVGSLTSNTTDYRLDPSTGMMNTISMEVAGFGGTNRYVKTITEHTLFHPLLFGVGSLRGTLGYVQGFGGKEIPIDEMFYLGGINSLRGYRSRTVSPNKTTPVPQLDATGGFAGMTESRVYLGGEMEAVANAEFTFPLLKEAGLKAVVFFDAGNAANSLNDTFGNILTSYGGGIRWFSPIGPLRLEYGIPINPRQGIDSGGRLEFSIGSIF
ncbi:outer membrane protein assembly factor BamA [Citrifermentans pelophilum]|uniref:outer membrane protein assembly factor BamA n=1 Tax=Geoanaerobacter pelophilus TaxID=60036 RepID=UPI001F3844B4|nr:outer membrane protein assembly factor BamA [Geoanaerobacter pelophilus]